MRQIVLDTETTGLEWQKGNRVVEIGCIELVQRRRSGREFHCYLNPEREFEDGAREVTGLNTEFLADKPRFAEIAEEFLAFIDGAELIIHNAAFDLGFLNAELERLPGLGRIEDRCRIEDTLLLARQRFPGQRNSLDALCRRLGVDNAHRVKHGALLDAELLAEVYLALTAGQGEIGFGEVPAAQAADTVIQAAAFAGDPARRPRVQVQAEELAAHQARLAALEKKAGRCLWRELEAAAG